MTPIQRDSQDTTVREAVAFPVPPARDPRTGPPTTRFFFRPLVVDGGRPRVRHWRCTRFREVSDMVSAWWLVVTFMAGGMAGVLVMALMTLAADPEPDEALPPVAR